MACSGGGHAGSSPPLERQPTQPAANAEPGFGVTPATIPPQAKRGEVVTVSFQTRPGTTCQLTLSGAKQPPQPVLAPAVAEPSGQVSWTWRVSTSLKPGSVTASAACSGGAAGQATMTIS